MKNTYFMSKKIMNESQFSDLIYRMVNESLDALSGYNFETNDNANDNNEQNDDSKKRNNRRRQQIEAFFKQPGVNPAAYAYRLYRVKPVEGDDTNDMKNARSKFMKCLNHEKNEDGYEYAFDSSEVNALFSMISGNELKENKLRLTESDLMYMVNESVKRILKESIDYQGNDLSYDSIFSQAEHIIPKIEQKGVLLKWRNIAKEMGFRLETLNDDDMELMKDAIEDAIAQYDSDMAKNIETKESWDEFDDEHEYYPSTVLFNAGTRKGHTDQDVDDALSIRNGEKYWNKRELANRDKMMKKYIDGSRDEYDIEDAWDGIHY